jgi:rhamnosyl/mannosyltransferase
VVPLGIRVEEFDGTSTTMAWAERIRQNHSGRPLVLFVGRLRYYKGLQFLVSAMPEIKADLLLAGTGPMENELRRMAAEAGVSNRVHFMGDVSDEEKLACYYAADVFCMPSHLRSEAFGLSQIEAMASGVPVVSTRIKSGVPYVNADGVSGLTVEPENPRALAEAISRILENEALRRQLAAGALERARTEFTDRRMCENVMAVYREVLKRG